MYKVSRHPQRTSSLGVNSIPVTPVTDLFENSPQLSSPGSYEHPRSNTVPTVPDEYVETWSLAETDSPGVASVDSRQQLVDCRASTILDINIMDLYDDCLQPKETETLQTQRRGQSERPCAEKCTHQRRDTLTSYSSSHREQGSSISHSTVYEETESFLMDATNDSRRAAIPTSRSLTWKSTSTSRSPTDSQRAFGANTAAPGGSTVATDRSATIGEVDKLGLHNSPPTFRKPSIHAFQAVHKGLEEENKTIVATKDTSQPFHTISFHARGSDFGGEHIFTCSLTDWQQFLLKSGRRDPADDSGTEESGEGVSAVDPDIKRTPTSSTTSHSRKTPSKGTKLGPFERLKRKTRWGDSVTATSKPYDLL